MLKIVKASAGSGKTWLLSHTYIDLLLSCKDDDEYRHVLAVTFTNKATDEMKERILQDLFEISCDSKDARAPKAGAVLHRILHDYGNFAVSTIDSFFQQTLRAFAHETGHYSSSQVELEKNELIEETVDGILESLDENSPEDSQFLDFITESMESEADSSRKPDIDRALKLMARELRSEQMWLKCAETGMNLAAEYTPEKLSAMRRELDAYVRDFRQSVIGKAGDVVDAALDAGLSPDDFNGGRRSWFQYFSKLAQSAPKDVLKLPTPAVRSSSENADRWFTKANSSLLGAAQKAITRPLEEFFSYFDENYPVYKTASVIKGNIYGLGIAHRLDKAFEELTSSRRVVCLDESNHLLKDIIDGSDTPFVYEKTGTRIRHYLLDEFQDTSVTQWDNFKPLLSEALSSEEEQFKGGGDVSNLIVGDVKQSIYRWRESDWGLLDGEVQKSFRGEQVGVESKQANYRSFEEIINFNNGFYPWLAEEIDSTLTGGGNKSVSAIYSDVRQSVGKEFHRGKGCVKLNFFSDEASELDAIYDSVRSCIEDFHANPGDIAVLVRTNDTGSKVASRLIEGGINVETQSSFALKSSLSVRRLVSMLSCVDNPDDRLNCYVALTLDIGPLPVAYHNLTGLCDSLYSVLCANPKYGEDCRREVVFVSAFMDYVRDYAEKNNDNLGAFLKYWEGQNPSVSSALSSDAVKIVTIHKSKGLAFPFVIVPFLEKMHLYNQRMTYKWCRPALQGTPLEAYSDKLFRVNLTSSTAATAFSSDYEKEKFQQAVDMINMLYVATTRARWGMQLIGCQGLKKGSDGESVADILFRYAAEKDLALGSMMDFQKTREEIEEMERKEEKKPVEQREISSCPMEYPVVPLGGRLRVRPYASEYFCGEDDRFRRRGVVFHEILSRVIVPSDLPSAVRRSVDEGLLENAEYDKVLAFLQKAVASHPEFFPVTADNHIPEGYRVLNERPIRCSDGDVKRPDRIVTSPDGSALIIDYKFGVMKDKYREQIEKYRTQLLGMGYKSVDAKLWFVYTGQIFSLKK